MFFKTFAAACGLAAGANAHISMAFPSIFTAPAVTNGPLSYDNFPCQATSAAYAGPTNTISLGAETDLQFNGQSVHGGGSCQISITYDEKPTRTSIWKVIKSFEGGCPARNTPGNLGDDTSATLPVPFKYNVTIPDNIPAGRGTLAWTWINKVGNREFYMNCAAIELEGTGGDESNYNNLPDMFVANLGGADKCTVGSGDFVYPAPGDVVEYGNGAVPSGADLATTEGVCTVGISAGGGSGGAASATTTAYAASQTADSGAVPGGVFATANAAAPSVTAAPAVSSAEATAVAAPSATAAPAAAANSGSSSSGSSGSSSSSSSSSSTAQTGACTTEGEYVCLGANYQVCASGQWSVAMPLASGTECAGTGNTFAIAASASKKSKSKFRRSREERRAAAAAQREKRGLKAMFGMP